MNERDLKRPSRIRPDVGGVRLQLKVSEELMRELERAAERRGQKVSDFVREELARIAERERREHRAQFVDPRQLELCALVPPSEVQ